MDFQSSDYVVCLLEKKERAIKRDKQKNAHENELGIKTLAMPSFGNSAYALPLTVIESAPIAERFTPIHGEAGVES